MTKPTKELTALVKRGDPAALADYLEAQRKPLLAYISHKFGSALRRKLEAEDVYQEVSVEAIRALPGVDLSERDPFGWLCQIAERKIIDATGVSTAPRNETPAVNWR